MFIKYDFSLVLKYAQSGTCVSTLRLSSVDYAFEALEGKAKCGKNSLNLISNGLLRIYMYLYVHLVSVVVMVVDCSRTERSPQVSEQLSTGSVGEGPLSRPGLPAPPLPVEAGGLPHTTGVSLH